MDKRGKEVTWNAEEDFLERYRTVMERVKRGDHAYNGVPQYGGDSESRVLCN